MDISLKILFSYEKKKDEEAVAASVLMPKEESSRWIEHLAKSYTPFGGISIPGVRLHLPQEEKQNLNVAVAAAFWCVSFCLFLPFTCDCCVDSVVL